jgi:hypothetical protein
LGLNKVGDIPLPELARRLSASESRRVTDVFHNSLREGRYVAAGADCPSLGAIGIDGRHLRFMHRTWEGERRLRCQFIDATGFRFDLPVTASHLRDVETKHGIAGLNASIDKSRRYHLRIGLANPFDNGRAYAMLNGAIPY